MKVKKYSSRFKLIIKNKIDMRLPSKRFIESEMSIYDKKLKKRDDDFELMGTNKKCYITFGSCEDDNIIGQRIYEIERKTNKLIILNGKRVIEKRTFYFYDSKIHKEDGYAYISVDKLEKGFLLNGKELTLKQFWERQKDTEYAAKIFATYFGADNDK